MTKAGGGKSKAAELAKRKEAKKWAKLRESARAGVSGAPWKPLVVARHFHQDRIDENIAIPSFSKLLKK